MNRYTKKRRNNGRIEVYDSSLNTWVLLSLMSSSDQNSCSDLNVDNSSGYSSYSNSSSGSSDYSSYDSGSSSCDSGNY